METTRYTEIKPLEPEIYIYIINKIPFPLHSRHIASPLQRPAFKSGCKCEKSERGANPV